MPDHVLDQLVEAEQQRCRDNHPCEADHNEYQSRHARHPKRGGDGLDMSFGRDPVFFLLAGRALHQLEYKCQPEEYPQEGLGHDALKGF